MSQGMNPPPPPPGYGTGYSAGDPSAAPLPGATMGQALQRFFQRYAQFRGRASRSEYWWSFLALVIVYIVIDVLTLANSHFLLLDILLLGVLAPSIGVGVRRLHDTDRSGWWWWIGIIPVVGTIILIVYYCQDSKPAGARFDA
jgi:uncharacterized membrane protein YhaH (DUF805 family)